MLRTVVGNPLIAIAMLRHDVTAGLFAPVELLLTEEENGRSAIDLCGFRQGNAAVFSAAFYRAGVWLV